MLVSHPSSSLLSSTSRKNNNVSATSPLLLVEAQQPSPPPSSSSSAPTSTPNPPNDPHHFPSLTTLPSEPILYIPILSGLPTKTAIESSSSSSLSSAVLPRGSVDPASLSLHKALHGFKPLDDNYAETSYEGAFNWDDLRLDRELEREWYCVVFRSKRNKKSRENDQKLYEADAKAHREAITAGGLLMYWYGVPSPTTGTNLATCIWQSRTAARAAIGGPEHIKAMRLAAVSYDFYRLERYVLRKLKGEEGVTVEEYVDGTEVGW